MAVRMDLRPASNHACIYVNFSLIRLLGTSGGLSYTCQHYGKLYAAMIKQ